MLWARDPAVADAAATTRLEAEAARVLEANPELRPPLLDRTLSEAPE